MGIRPSGGPFVALLVALGVAALAGCAGVRYRALPPGGDGPGDGIVYYESSLYLLVYSDGKGGIGHQILQLPDPTKRRVASPYNTMARLDLTLTFTNGYLTQAKEEADTTAVPAAVLQAIGTVLPGLLALNRAGLAPDQAKDEYCVPAPRLYKIVVEGDRVSLHGGPGDQPVYVSLLDKPKGAAASDAPGMGGGP